MSNEDKQFITEPGIFECCMCKKKLDLINTEDSIFFCCQKQLATCMSCARNFCPKCNKQRIFKTYRRLLKAKTNLNSKLIADKPKSLAPPQAKVNIPKESLISKRQKMMPTSHLTENKPNQQSQKKIFSEKAQQTLVTKSICMSCLQQTPQTSRAKTQSASQFTICQHCLDTSRLYEQKLKKKVQSQLQQKKQKYIKQEVKCVSCQVLVPNDSVLNWGDSSLGITFCKECYNKHMQEQTKKLSLEKNKLSQIRQNKKEEKDNIKIEQSEVKIEEKQQNKMKQRPTEKNIDLKIQDNELPHTRKNYHLSLKPVQKKQKIIDPSLISVTAIERSRTQDQRDLTRKFSTEEADEELLDIQIGINKNKGQSLISNQSKLTKNIFSKTNNAENRFKSFNISDKPQNYECQVCKYILSEKDGFWYNKNEISKHRNKLLDLNIYIPQHLNNEQFPVFMCVNCIDTQLEVIKIQKLYKESHQKYF